MPKAFFTINRKVRAQVSIRRNSDGTRQSLGKAIPDGDTVGVHVQGSGSVRFLGIDTPEKSFELPAGSGRRLDSGPWETYLSDPFATQFGDFDIDDDLTDHLKGRVGPGAASNHRRQGENSEKVLTGLIESDMQTLGQDADSFGFFLAFAFEVFDSFGRFLAFINRDQPDRNQPEPRPRSYNERMLERGAALPYYIWPNIDPFRSGQSILEAVIPPGGARLVAEQTGALRRSRESVKKARTDGIGVFDPTDPLRFEAFEVRYIGRRKPPSRAVIDLSRDDDVILRPQSYFKIPLAEDRLFIPGAFVPLFVARGWRLEGWS